jgi:arylsulfatase A-like enzyme
MRVDRRVSNLDITPTVLQELSVPYPESLAGVPLQQDVDSDGDRFVLVRPPEVRNTARAPHRLRVIKTVVGEPVLPATDPRTRGIVDLMWKFLRAPDSEQLFQLPDERSNRAATEPETRDRMIQALETEMLRFPAGASAQEDRDPETLEALEALGYVQ